MTVSELSFNIEQQLGSQCNKIQVLGLVFEINQMECLQDYIKDSLKLSIKYLTNLSTKLKS